MVRLYRNEYLDATLSLIDFIDRIPILLEQSQKGLLGNQFQIFIGHEEGVHIYKSVFKGCGFDAHNVASIPQCQWRTRDVSGLAPDGGRVSTSSITAG
jgi:hypothetical protein